MEWRIRPTGDDATIAWQGKRIAELETRLADLDRIASNIRIHLEQLCSDDIREHGYIAHDHDIDFQVFRALCGYKEALVEMVELQEAVKWLLEVQGVVNDNIMCPQWRRHTGLSDIERTARAAVDALVGGENAN